MSSIITRSSATAFVAGAAFTYVALHPGTGAIVNAIKAIATDCIGFTTTIPLVIVGSALYLTYLVLRTCLTGVRLFVFNMYNT